MTKYLSMFWDFVDSRSIIRRINLLSVLWLSWASFQWAMLFATETAKSGAEVGLIIAAVTAPIAGLQAFVVKVYSDARNN